MRTMGKERERKRKTNRELETEGERGEIAGFEPRTSVSQSGAATYETPLLPK